MNAYRLVCNGIFAILMAEDDEAMTKRVFGHLENARVTAEEGLPTAALPMEPTFITEATVERLGDTEDQPILRVQVWSDGVRLMPPEGEKH